jgi:hypothetical protein
MVLSQNSPRSSTTATVGHSPVPPALEPIPYAVRGKEGSGYSRDLRSNGWDFKEHDFPSQDRFVFPRIAELRFARSVSTGSTGQRDAKGYAAVLRGASCVQAVPAVKHDTRNNDASSYHQVNVDGSNKMQRVTAEKY